MDSASDRPGTLCASTAAAAPRDADPQHPGPQRWLRAAAMAGLVLALAAIGQTILPRGLDGAALLRAADDPVRLSELRLTAIATPQRMADEIDAAIAKGDPELAGSFLALADARGVAIDAERRRRVEVLAGSEGSGDPASGGSWLASADSIAADVIGLSDVRDLWQEGGKLVQGAPYDGVVLGLSAAGLALTGLTLATLLPSGGTSAAARIPAARGLGLVKAASRAGLLSRALVERIGGLTVAALDRGALAETMTAARALDLTAARAAARTVLRPGAVRTLTNLGGDLAAIEGRLGQRGAVQALAVARDATEVSRVRRLAAAFGTRTRAILTLLGPAALVLGNVAAVLLQAVWLALGWMFGAALLARRLGTLLGRAIWANPRAGLRRRRPWVRPRLSYR